MRCLTAAKIKRQRRAGRPLQECPREGSNLRAIYDTLQANKGQPVEMVMTPATYMRFRNLTDFYGLDIRMVGRGDRRVNRPSQVLLAGEWFGRVYVDYVAERLEQEVAQ